MVDLGCGEGTATASLAARWPGARVTGVDSSAEMLAAAAQVAVPGRLEFVAGDVRDLGARRPGRRRRQQRGAALGARARRRCSPAGPAWLAPGGWLAVQVPGNFRAPTHALLAELCRSPRWADRLADAAPRPDAVLEPAGYLDVLTAAGLAADVWETTYLHVLTGADPVLGWVRSTVAAAGTGRPRRRRRGRLHRRVRRRPARGLPAPGRRHHRAAVPAGLRRRAAGRPERPCRSRS